ncbi:hypothetical protein QL285_073414 [Trifolium repens]|nr:hypothetical protein QL285_073414 [Trifolium repens]
MCWSPPPRNFLKLNVDAHLHDDGRWGFGMVLRGEDSYFVGATTKVLKGSDDATLAESMGICEALLWIETLRRDAEGIVKALEKNKFPRTNWGLTVNRISRDLVNLDHVSVKWVNRKGNQAAHDLARFAFVEPNKT